MGKKFTSLIEDKHSNTRPNTEMGQKKNTYHGVRYSSVQRPTNETTSISLGPNTTFRTRKGTQAGMVITNERNSFDTETEKMSSHVTSGNNLASKFMQKQGQRTFIKSPLKNDYDPDHSLIIQIDQNSQDESSIQKMMVSQTHESDGSPDPAETRIKLINKLKQLASKASNLLKKPLNVRNVELEMPESRTAFHKYRSISGLDSHSNQKKRHCSQDGSPAMMNSKSQPQNHLSRMRNLNRTTTMNVTKQPKTSNWTQLQITQQTHK